MKIQNTIEKIRQKSLAFEEIEDKYCEKTF